MDDKDETLPEPDHYCGSGPRFGATAIGYYTAATLREAVKMAKKDVLIKAIDLVNDLEEPAWYGYENPYRFDDGQRAAWAALRKLLEDEQ